MASVDAARLAARSDDAMTMPIQRRRVVFAGAIGSVVEYYDFGVYGYAATTLAALFFPSSSPTASLLATLAVFAIAFVARPIGSILFGHVGDHYGRKPALAIAVLLMALATFAMGLLPTHAAIGLTAPTLLVVARLLQGLSAGGEVSGAASFLAEAAPANRRGLMSSATQVGSVSGLLLASAVVGVMNLILTPQQFADYGWRIPFLLGLPTGLIGLYVRNRLEDTAAFRKLEQRREVVSLPTVELFRTSFIPVLKGIGMNAANFAGYYLVFVYFSIYLQTAGTLTRAQATWSTTTALIVAAVTVAFFGLLSDVIGRKWVIGGSSVGFIVLTLPMFKVMQSSDVKLIVAAHAVMALCEAAVLGAIWGALTELFPTRVRYSGVGISFNIAGVLVGGSAPYTATWLIQQTGDKSSPAYFLMAVGAVTLLTLFTVPETASRKMLE
jgi:MHS family proline/betaine transporter-like MFS transporter